MRSLRFLAFWAALSAGPASAWAQSGEVRIGGVLLATKQNLVSPTSLVRSTGGMGGVEFLARNDVAGIFVRYLAGTPGDKSARGNDGRLRAGEVRLLLGPPVFSVEGGYELRARSGSLGEPRDGLFRAGARSSIPLGPSGLSVSLNAGAMVRQDSSGKDKKLAIIGWEGTTGLFYQAPHGLPFYVMLGYRYERFRTEAQISPVMREELSSVVGGVGIRYLGKRRQHTAQPTP